MSDNIARRLKDLEERVGNLELIEYSKIVFKVLSHTTGTAWSTVTSRSASDDALIDLSATFGTPDNIKAIFVRVDMSDGDGSAPLALCSMGPSASPSEALFYADPAYNNEWAITTTVVSCDSNGDIYITFSETTDQFRFSIIGYII